MSDAWIPPGRAVTVGPYRIADGMVYVGSDLTAVAGRSREASFIDPALPLRSDRPDHRGVGLSYRPSYASLSPPCRAAYLEWLAGGRSSPDAPLGYVFLFFFGLERRLLVDQAPDAVCAAERPLLIAEIARLKRHYAHLGSFGDYAAQLLAAFSSPDPSGAASGDAESPEGPGSLHGEELHRGFERLAAARRPMPADWALAWLWQQPWSQLRKPAFRCKVEFEALFKARYTRAFGPGLRLKSRKVRIGDHYFPASPSLGARGAFRTPGREDRQLIETETVSAKLLAIATDCCQELDAYSRYLGRNPGGALHLAAAALLPRDLVMSNTTAAPLKAWLDRTVPGSSPTVVPLADLPLGLGAMPARRDTLVVLADLAGKLGFAFEPDPRRQTRQGLHLTHLAFFRTDGDSRDRLDALAMALSRIPMITRDIRACLDPLGQAEKEGVVRRVAALSAGRGLDLPGRVALLEKLYESAGMGKQQAYRDPHDQNCDSGADDLVTILSTDGNRTTYRLPDPPPAPSGQPLDQARIARRIRETAEVASLLGAIFAESPEEGLQPASGGAIVTPLGRLMQALEGAERVSRSDFQALCKPLGLPVDGTIEALNELAFDVAGEALLAGTDPIFVSADILKTLIG